VIAPLRGPAARDDCERHAGLLLLLMLAARETANWAEMTARMLTAIGWQTGHGQPLTSSGAFHAAWSTHSVLSRQGVIFARATLVTWPAVR
jgi:hypothetical protein